MNVSIFQNFPKCEFNLRKFWKNLVILLKTWPKIEQIDICMGHFFLKNLYFFGSTFKFCSGTSLPKPNLNTPCEVKIVWITHSSTYLFGLKFDRSFEEGELQTLFLAFFPAARHYFEFHQTYHCYEYVPRYESAAWGRDSISPTVKNWWIQLNWFIVLKHIHPEGAVLIKN